MKNCFAILITLKKPPKYYAQTSKASVPIIFSNTSSGLSSTLFWLLSPVELFKRNPQLWFKNAVMCKLDFSDIA